MHHSHFSAVALRNIKFSIAICTATATASWQRARESEIKHNKIFKLKYILLHSIFTRMSFPWTGRPL